MSAIKFVSRLQQALLTEQEEADALSEEGVQSVRVPYVRIMTVVSADEQVGRVPG